MILNENRLFRHKETSQDGVTTFVLDGSPTAEGVKSNAATVSFAAISVSPGTAATAQNLTTEVKAMDQAGKFILTWLIAIGGQAFRRVQTYFIAFYDIWTWVREILRVSATALPDTDIDNILVQIVGDIEENYPTATCLPYRLLTGNDRYYMDRGLAYVVAAYLMNQNPARFIGGAVRSVADAQIRYEFALAPQKAGALSRAEQLLGMGWTEFQRVSCLAEIAEDEPSELFALAGPRRGSREAAGFMGVNAIPLYSVLVRRMVLI